MHATTAHLACTIVARNYIAQARVLARSLAEHNPGVRFATLLIDGVADDRTTAGIGEVLLPEDLGIDPEVLAQMQTIYQVMEFATALKPDLLLHALRNGARTATYFDPDIRVYADLSDVFETAAEAGMALTPHTVAPVPRDGLMLSETAIMQSGIYNLGFIAVSADNFPFLAWWADRLRTDSIVDFGQSLFTDQRWVDWAPSLTQPTVLRDPGLNAAYWNLHERRVSQVDGHWRVNDSPLRFYHFSGYDPARPWVLSSYQGVRPRNLLSESPALRSLCDSYGAELTEAGHMDLRDQPYRFAKLSTGLVLTPMIRRLYRAAILETGGSTSGLPDPWQDPTAFQAWLLDPALRVGAQSLTRFEYGIWASRPTTPVVFPDPLGADSGRLRDWLDVRANVEGDYVQAGLDVPTDLPRRNPRARPRHGSAGWSLVRYPDQGWRADDVSGRLTDCFGLAGIGCGTSEVSTGQPALTGGTEVATEPWYRNTLVCADPVQTSRISATLELSAARGRRVGYLLCDDGALPSSLVPTLAEVDEVWVPSEFARAGITRVSGLPVHVVPLPASLPTAPTPFTRNQLGVPDDRFAFLVDVVSVGRQNPLGAIAAYRRAFPDLGDTCLVIRLDEAVPMLDREQVRLAADREDMLILEGPLTAAQSLGLLEVVDCVVSLHRAEGYGLHLLDAMARSTPVVATGYSGNTSFQDARSAVLLPFELRPPDASSGIVGEGALWAEPDVAAAALALRRIHGDRQYVATLNAAALERAQEHSPGQIANLLLPLLLGAEATSRLRKAVR